MTLLAAWIEDGVPILIGDVLITSDMPGGHRHYPLPTRDDLDARIPTGVKVEESFQKVSKISDSFVLGFCGSSFSARDVLSLTVTAFKDREPSIDKVRQHFQGITDHRQPSCTFIGWVVDADSAQCFRWCSSEPHDFQTGVSFADGGAASLFHSLYSSARRFGDRPIEQAIGIIGELLKNEVIYGTNLEKRFGGGFQLLHYNDSQFEITPSILFVFMRFEELDNTRDLNGLLPDRMLKIQMKNDVLEIMALRYGEMNGTSSAHGVRFDAITEMHYVFPLTVSDGDPFILDSNLPFESDYYCFCCDIKLRDEIPGSPGDICIVTLVFTVPSKAADEFIRIEHPQADVESVEFMDGLSKRVFSFLSSLNRDLILTQSPAN